MRIALFKSMATVVVVIATLGASTPVAAQDDSLGLGDQGPRVENAQDLLNQYLALTDSDLALIAEDGIFGINTSTAVRAFEADNDKPVNGVLTLGDSVALTALVAALEQDSPAILAGDDGREVESWQAELNSWNRLTMNELPIETDGIFGPNSQAATRQFETEAGLQVDGIVEAEDRTAMRATLADLRADAGDLPPLSIGDAGALVLSAQSLLNDYFAYSDIKIGLLSEDGLFGRNTRDGVLAFEAAQGRAQDGALSRADIDALRVAVVDLETNAAGTVVGLGDEGQLVETWQRPLTEWLRLADVELEPIAVDGVFGASTFRATTRFERLAGLQVDGIVEPSDRVALREALERLRKETIEGTIADASTLGDIVSAADFTTAEADLLRLYYVFFDRSPDVGGAKYWIERSQTELSYVDVARFFARSPEFIETYGALDNEAFIAVLYRNALEREPDGSGYNFWVEQLNEGLRDRADVVRQFGFSPEFIAANPFGGL